MKGSVKQAALVGCVSVMVSGCATQQGMAPEYRLSSSSVALPDGASMLQRGRAQLAAGLDALAIESFRSEIRINPDSADAYNGLAVAYDRIGRSDLAQRYFETALAKDPANINAQRNLARLKGEAAPVVQMALADVMPTPEVEPVAVTASFEPTATELFAEPLEPPLLGLAQMRATTPDTQSNEVLARQGVLSSQFTAAPARLATAVRVAAMPEKPDAPPRMPKPALPATDLLPQYRPGGTRLERVSLGEVRLITRPTLPAEPPRTGPDFASFGDRLAIWLPQSVATEQAGNRHGMIEASVILAAVERAEERQKLAMMVEAPVELPDFAYLFFSGDYETAIV
jgi:hypothetical protein